MEFYDYFQSYKGYFWRWEDNTEVVSIPGGSTVAYRDHLLQIIDSLSVQGLPPFGALLLAIVATNKTLDNSMAHIVELVKQTVLKQGDAMHGYISVSDEASEMANILARLPDSYKVGARRVQLFQTLFDSCHNIVGVQKSTQIVSITKSLLERNKGKLIDQLSKQKEFNIITFQKDFRCLGLLLKKFPDTDSIITAMANLPVIEETIVQIEPQKNEEPISKDFIQELIDNPKTFQVGALIKHIWSGLNIPFHQNLPSEQPLGGISDLTNKGDFDKLLISEFANDDLVFLSRLANNEALYLHREIPPAKDSVERILLIDVSIKNWGSPKLLAYALALAITRHPKTDFHCTAFALGSGFYPLSFETIHDVIESLNVTDGVLHPAEGLEKFFKEYSNTKQLEIFYISSPNTLKLPQMQKVINDHYAAFKYWVNVEADGSLELYRNQKNSKKLVQQFQVPMHGIWNKKGAAARTEDEQLILKNQVPILYPKSHKIKNRLFYKDEQFVVVNRKLFRLAAIDRSNKGLELMFDDIPSSITEYAIGRTNDEELLLLMFKAHTREITIQNLTKKTNQVVYFNQWRSQFESLFFFDENAFHYVARHLHYIIECGPQIKVSATSEDQEKWFEKCTRKIDELIGAEKLYHGQDGVLKNIQKIYINQNNNLVFNKHELRIDNHRNIRFSLVASSAGRASKAVAKQNETGNEFVFSNESRIIVDRSGMIILEPNIDGQAQTFEVVLETPGANKISVLQTMMAYGLRGLKETKEKLDSWPCIVDHNLSITVAEQLKKNIEEAGGQVSIQPSSYGNPVFIPSVSTGILGLATPGNFTGNEYFYNDKVPLKKISTQFFFEHYITPFITAITEHGA